MATTTWAPATNKIDDIAKNSVDSAGKQVKSAVNKVGKILRG